MLTRPDPPKYGRIVTRPDPTRGSIRPVYFSDPVLDLSGGWGSTPPPVPLHPQVCIDPPPEKIVGISQKYIADPPSLVFPQIEYCSDPAHPHFTGSPGPTLNQRHILINMHIDTNYGGPELNWAAFITLLFNYLGFYFSYFEMMLHFANQTE